MIWKKIVFSLVSKYQTYSPPDWLRIRPPPPPPHKKASKGLVATAE